MQPIRRFYVGILQKSICRSDTSRDRGLMMFLSDHEMTSIGDYWYSPVVGIVAKTPSTKIFRTGGGGMDRTYLHVEGGSEIER